MTANLAQIEALKNALTHTTLLDETQKKMWIDQVLPKANQAQLAQMEDIFKQEREAYNTQAENLKRKTDLIKQATKKINEQKRHKKEDAQHQAEAEDLAALEHELQDL